MQGESTAGRASMLANMRYHTNVIISLFSALGSLAASSRKLMKTGAYALRIRQLEDIAAEIAAGASPAPTFTSLSVREGLLTPFSCHLMVVKPGVYAVRICRAKDCTARVGVDAAAGAASPVMAATLSADLHVLKQCCTCVVVTRHYTHAQEMAGWGARAGRRRKCGRGAHRGSRG